MEAAINHLRNLYESDVSILDIDRSVSDLDNALQDPSNPLTQEIPLASKNIFINVINFGLVHNKDLLCTILRHTTTGSNNYNEETVIFTARLFTEIASRINPKCTTLNKLRAVFLQACGLTTTGIDAFHKLGETECSRTLLNTRTKLAIKDEESIRQGSFNLVN